MRRTHTRHHNILHLVRVHTVSCTETWVWAPGLDHGYTMQRGNFMNSGMVLYSLLLFSSSIAYPLSRRKGWWWERKESSLGEVESHRHKAPVNIFWQKKWEQERPDIYLLMAVFIDLVTAEVVVLSWELWFQMWTLGLRALWSPEAVGWLACYLHMIMWALNRVHWPLICLFFMRVQDQTSVFYVVRGNELWAE